MEKNFERWKRSVDRAVESRIGLSADDLPDCPYRDWFEDDVPPDAAACRAIMEAGG